MAQLLLTLWSLVVIGAAAFAQEPVAQGPEAAALPGVVEVIPRLAQLREQGLNLELRLAQIRDSAEFRRQLQALEQRQQEIGKRMTDTGDPAGWSFDRLQEVRGDLVEQRDAIGKVLDDLSRRLAEMEQLRKDWLGKEKFWQEWKAQLQALEQEFSLEAFSEAGKLIAQAQKGLAESNAPLVGLQKEIIDVQARALDRLNIISGHLNALRGQTFKKTSPSFADRDFYRQFTAELWAAVKAGVLRVRPVDRLFWQENGWLLAMQVLIVLTLSPLIIRHRRRPDVTPEWQFITRHPWATGIFVAQAALNPLYSSPPALWRLFSGVLGALAASVLVAGLLRNPRKIFMVYLLAFLVVLSLGLQIISFPQPLYRIYLALLSLLGIPLLLWLAMRQRRAHQGRGGWFAQVLQAGALILGLSLVAQCAGFNLLASRLIEASVGTVFLALFTYMAIRLGRGGIEFLLTHPRVAERPFFRRFGAELTRRLQGVLEAVLIGLALLYLLVVWGLFDSAAQAWKVLLGLGFAVGEINISLEMLFWVGVVLYFSIVFSWFIRAVLDTQIFPRREFDRGVRDAIKKLLHYSLVFIGFLLAMSLAGFELRNFAVLAGAFGIGIGFGLQNIVNNFISGIILLFERPIKVGDMIVLDSEWGRVRKIGLRSTIVETLDQSEIIVPNSQLISEKVTNWTLSTQVARLVLPVGVAYGSNVKLVLSILKEVAVQHPDVLSEPAPSPIFKGFGDSSLDFELRVWVTDINRRLRIISELNQAIDQGFRDGQVEIPFPQRDLHLRSVDEALLARSWGAGGKTPRTGVAAEEEKEVVPRFTETDGGEEPEARED
ncbi:hypothetical protein DESUT3_40110 [Desulfuromonas versatilis]|uniref:MscS Mechanosensitive ion channel n=1 Tax=Desulfuromonas versatilis TaxID=2802975 RepID=A0ABM8I306_9BACT|nr:mechanosensitive ion channel domain-containing protein [Desulfuromonas versatilis]BCR06942.1 hypothetical protein DESUT3_40110 [Desulfuromonas versatilis]